LGEPAEGGDFTALERCEQIRTSVFLGGEPTWRTTFVSQVEPGQKPAELIVGEQTLALKAGELLQLGDALQTGDTRVEIRDLNGLIMRLGPGSECSIERTPGGIVLVYSGEVYKTRYDAPQIQACAKYRTSCYVRCSVPLFTKPGETPNTDMFYGLFNETDIWEYDENGRRFPIVSVPEGYRVTLAYLEAMPMRQRYTVTEVVPISDQEYDYISAHYMNPKHWR
jgi:hypothetical protein